MKIYGITKVSLIHTVGGKQHENTGGESIIDYIKITFYLEQSDPECWSILTLLNENEIVTEIGCSFAFSRSDKSKCLLSKMG